MWFKSEHRLAALALLVTVACLWPTSSFTQQESSPWVRFVGTRIQRLYQQSPSGLRLISEIRESVARNWDGSLYTRIVPNPSSPAWIRGTLVDGRSGKTYILDYEHHYAILQARGTHIPLATPTGEEYQRIAPERSLGTRTIAGVQCIGFTNGNNGQTWETWVAPSLNYQVIERTSPLGGENTFVEKMTFEEIQVGAKPDPQLFHIPEGFQTMVGGPWSEH